MSGESRVLVLRLALRAIRWRAAASVAVFVVAVVAIVAATVGPIYLPAVNDTVLARHLTDALPLQRDVLVSRQTEIGYPGVNWAGQVQEIAGRVSRDRRFAPPVYEQQLSVTYGGSEPLKSELVHVDALCAHLHITSGSCALGNPGATLISTTTAAAEHLKVGSRLVTSSQATVTTGAVTIPLRVVGIYRPIAPDGAFWDPWYLFQFGQPASPNQLPPGDASFVSAAALTSRLHSASETLSANVALLPQRVRYAESGTLRTTIARANAAVARLITAAGSTGVPVVSVTTGLPTVLDQTAKETSLARTLVTVATAQLALLAILLLYAVVANTTNAQGPEVALAKLRGRRPGSILLQSVAQPMASVLAAGPVAALLAWLIVRLLAPHLVGHSVKVSFPPAAYGVAVLAVAGGVLATVIAARRIVVTPVAELMRLGSAPPGSPVGLLIADVAAVTIAVAGLIELDAAGVLDSGKPNPLSVLAPTLLAVAVAVVVLRLLPFLARRLARWTRDSQRLVTFLVVRQLLRRPGEVRAVLLVAVAVSIAAFAVTTWADSGHNRSLRALNSAGAENVLVVRPGAGVDDLRTAVDRADPSGQSMAVAYTSYGRLPPLIAVDTARFASVGAWVPGDSSLPLASIVRRLDDRVAPVIASGTRLRLRVDLVKYPHGPLRLAVTFARPDHSQALRTVVLVGPGTRSYVIALPSACARGCRITALGLKALTSAEQGEIKAQITASVLSHGRWRPVSSFAD
ncbi:MAG TPA: FtsX-like permease family protein, partial [Solirubrobacteraceae bacterium]|nr:FtsX-like permease family protein [Solirubrobacteraceae bacterium]